MKFTQAWAATASQNVALKFVVAALMVCTIGLAASTAKLALKDPLVIERGCFSRVASTAATEHTTEEVETFVREAIAARFNSSEQERSVLLSEEENHARLQEQKELTARGMTQRVLANSIKIEGQTAKVDADRLISAGQIRSTFIFPLIFSLQSQTRTEANPYGLVLVKTVSVSTSGEKHE